MASEQTERIAKIVKEEWVSNEDISDLLDGSVMSPELGAKVLLIGLLRDIRNGLFTNGAGLAETLDGTLVELETTLKNGLSNIADNLPVT